MNAFRKSLFPRLAVATSVAIAVVIQACSSPKTPGPATPVPSAGAAQPAVPCPDNTDTPQIIEYTVGVSYRAFKQNPANALPSCFVEAIGAKVKSYNDTILSMVLQMSDTLFAHQPTDAANLAGRIPLLTHMTRYREVPGTFDRLLRVDSSKATLANYRLALAATVRGNDSQARLRYLTAAARKFPNATSIVADYNIQRQIPRLIALIDSTHQIMRLDPRRTGGYATLASIYGNLDMPDSALAYTRKALAAGVPRSDVAPSLQSLIGVVMRKAQLVDTPDLWDKTLPIAHQIDETLSTDASKHLLALSWVQVSSNYVNMARYALGGTEAELANHARTLADAPTRAKACQALGMVPGFLDQASRALEQGGNRFSTESVPAIQSGISIVRADAAQVRKRCPG